MIKLTNEQQAIVDCRDRVMLVEAPPGTGKTEIATHMVNAFINEGVNPKKIRCISFAKLDALKFEERMMELLGDYDVPPTIGTGHSLDYRICHRAERKAKASKFLKKNGQIRLYTGREQGNIVRGAVWSVLDSPKEQHVPFYGDKISLLKSAGFRPVTNADDLAFKVYTCYQQKMNIAGAMDYGDLMLNAETVLLNQSEILEEFKADVIVIDEAPDISMQQWEVLKLLFPYTKFVRIMGDMNQSIYGWRNALGLELIDKMRQVFGDNITIKSMTMNHRSLEEIVAHAESVIPCGMVSTRGKGGYIEVIDKVYSPNEHAELIADKICELAKQGYKFNEISVLCRTRAVMPLIQANLAARNIPYKTPSDSFTKLPEVQDLCAWVRMSNPEYLFQYPYRCRRGMKWGAFMSEHPFRRIYQAPAIPLTRDKQPVFNQQGDQRCLNQSWLNLVWKRHKKYPKVDTILNPSVYPPQYHEALRTLRQNIDEVTFMDNAHDIIMYVLYKMSPNYYKFHIERTVGEEYPEVHMGKLVDIARAHPDPTEFIAYMQRLHTDKAFASNAVEVTTMHKSKGRTDWRAVFSVDVVRKKRDDDNMDEKTRLRYVVITRAKDHVVETIVDATEKP